MIDWIKKFFVSEDKETNKRPKCGACGLGATKYMLIEFQTLELIEIEEIGRAHVRTPVTRGSRMPSSA